MQAAHYDTHAGVLREIGDRLRERLSPVRITPGRILDLACGTGHQATRLALAYPRATVVAVDSEPLHLTAVPTRGGLFGTRRIVRLAARSGTAVLKPDSMDLLFSNMLLPWMDHPEHEISWQVDLLAPGGLMVCSTLGAGSFPQWRDLNVPGFPSPTFPDMHDLGDYLVAAGLSGVVMESEMLHVTYPSPTAFLREIMALGNAPSCWGNDSERSDQAPRRAFLRRYPRDQATQRVTVTIEVVYAHGWRPANTATVAFRPNFPAS